MKYATTVNDKTFVIEINDDRHVTVDGETYEIDFQAVSGQRLYSLLIGGRSHEAHVEPTDDGWSVLHKGDLYQVQVTDERAQRLAKAAGGTAATTGEFHLKAPMPGLVVRVPVRVGQTIAQGDILLILESMKMQNEFKAPRDGTVKLVRVREGESVAQNQVLVVVG